MIRLPALSLLTAIVALALLALPAAVAAQDDLTQTYTTVDGALTFQHPANWAVVEQFGTITLANSQEALDALNRAAPLAAGQVTVAIVPPAGLVEQLALLGLSADGGPEALIADYVSLLGAATFSPPQSVTAGDTPVVRSSGISLGMAQALYAIAIDGGGMALIAAAAPDNNTLEATEPTLLAIIDSFDARPITEPVETGSVVWQQMVALPGEQVIEGGVNGFLDVVAGPDDTIYVLDAIQGVHVYAPDGTYEGLLGGPGAQYYFADVTVAPDGTLWGVDFAGTVTQVSPEDGSALASFSVTDQAGIPIGFNVQIGAGPDGGIYLLTTVPGSAENQQVGQVVVVDASGQVIRQFEIGRAEFYYDATMTFGPDGNLYAVEVGGNQGVRVFDTQGNLLREGIGAAVLFVSPGALAVAPDSTIYAGAAATGAIYHFAPDGTLRGRFGQSQFELFAPETQTQDYPPFEPGVFFEIGGLAVLSDGDVVVADGNPTYAQLVRVSFD